MSQKNTEFIRAARCQAVLSALFSGGWLLLCAMALLLVRALWRPSEPLSGILLILAILNMLLLIPLLFSLRQRFKEIQGGEEYEARQY